MARSIGVKFDSGWKEFAGAVSPKNFNSALKREIARAIARTGKYATKTARKAISGGGFEANARLTIALKGSTKPLVDNGDLWQGITTTAVSWNAAFVGFAKRNAELYSIAKLLHDGGLIPVTEKMRSMFLALARATDPDEWKKPALYGRALEIFEARKSSERILPLRPETKAIRIPARPFLDKVFEDPVLKARFEEEIREAIQRSIQAARRRAKKGGPK